MGVDDRLEARPREADRLAAVEGGAMGAIATAAKHLIAAGVTGDALVTALEEIEDAAAPKRSKGAERQARYRERKTTGNITGDVTRDAPTVPSDASDAKKRAVSPSPPSAAPSSGPPPSS